jgi:hypothetical protein
MADDSSDLNLLRSDTPKSIDLKSVRFDQADAHTKPI